MKGGTFSFISCIGCCWKKKSIPTETYLSSSSRTTSCKSNDIICDNIKRWEVGAISFRAEFYWTIQLCLKYSGIMESVKLKQFSRHSRGELFIIISNTYVLRNVTAHLALKINEYNKFSGKHLKIGHHIAFSLWRCRESVYLAWLCVYVWYSSISIPYISLSKSLSLCVVSKIEFSFPVPTEKVSTENTLSLHVCAIGCVRLDVLENWRKEESVTSSR